VSVSPFTSEQFCVNVMVCASFADDESATHVGAEFPDGVTALAVFEYVE